MSTERPAGAERTDKLIGEVLASRYRVEARLGEGAMGAVYKARHVKVGRAFAVKVLHPRLVIDDKVLLRFEREAELAGRLHHPNVIGVVDVGETSDGLRFMVMDFAEGPDLLALLAEAPMPPRRIIHLVRQMLEGLFHAHSLGLIHRDFKPENVIVEKDAHGSEVPRIVDFGIAILSEGGESNDGPGRLTTEGLVLGTPHYMAPEQAVNEPIDHRIDLFALGIMVYEMLCGKLPFDGNAAMVARANLMLDPPAISVRVPYLEVDPLLEAYARRLMAKSRDARPPTAKVARDLLDLIERDREAAAAQLGVPVAATRTPRTTEAVVPRTIDENYPGTFPPPMRTELATVAGPPPVAHPDHATETVEPLARRKRGVIIGLAIGGLALIAILVELTLGETTPRSVSEVPVATVAAPPAVPVAVAATPEPAVVPIAPPLETGSAVVAAPTPAPKLAHHAPPPAPRLDTHPASGSAAAVAPPVPVPVAAYDANAFVTQLKSVGAELHAFAESHPDIAGDLQSRFTRLDVSAALAKQATRDAARTTLDQIHAELARRTK